MLVGVSAVAAGALAGCGGTEMPMGMGCGDTASKQAMTVPAATVMSLQVGKAVLVPNSSLFLAKDAQGLFVVDGICTHAGCPTAYVPATNTYDCGCHGSQFALDGTVKRSPAAKALSHISACKKDDGSIVIEPLIKLTTTTGRIV